jgi:hypothetical protein
MVASPYRLPSARDADEAALWGGEVGSRCRRPQTAVHVLMPDASAGSRIILGGSERLQVGTRRDAKRRGSGLGALHHSTSGRSARGQGVGGSGASRSGLPDAVAC